MERIKLVRSLIKVIGADDDDYKLIDELDNIMKRLEKIEPPNPHRRDEWAKDIESFDVLPPLNRCAILAGDSYGTSAAAIHARIGDRLAASPRPIP